MRSLLTTFLCFRALSALAIEPSFEAAREQALGGRRVEARATCEAILAKDPQNGEVRTLLGRLYAWEKEFDSARRELRQVMTQHPSDSDARSALIDVELWAQNPSEALRLADEGLKLEPNNHVLHYGKARAFRESGDKISALANVARALKIKPEYAEAQGLSEALLQSTSSYTGGAIYTLDLFDSAFAPWNQLALSLSRKLEWGLLLGRVNLAKKFGEMGAQFEADAYPLVWKQMYAYLNLGYSPSDIFPQLRAGAELYAPISVGAEASLGVRYLKFSTAVTLLTGSLAKYLGSYWICLRPYYALGSGGSTLSGAVEVRRYLTDQDYLMLSVGTGSSTEQEPSTLDFFELASHRATVGGVFGLGRQLTLSPSVGLKRQERRTGGNFLQYTVAVGVEKRL